MAESKIKNYKIEFKKSVEKDIRGIPKETLKKIFSAIEALKESPRPSGSKKLSAQNAYRIRINNYRVIYEINDGVLLIVVIKIAHRKEAYK